MSAHGFLRDKYYPNRFKSEHAEPYKLRVAQVFDPDFARGYVNVGSRDYILPARVLSQIENEWDGEFEPYD